MSNLVSFNPNLTTAPANTFQVQTEGYVAGTFYSDDPAIRLSLLAGQIASTFSGPMWGGMALTEGIPAPNTTAGALPISAATAVSNLTAFSVFNQANNAIILPGNTVQQAVAGMSMSYFRLGSNATIAVPVDPSLAAALDNGNTNQQVSWDFNNNILQTYDASTPTVNVTSLTASFNSVTGIWTFAVVAAAATVVGAVGDAINLSGVTGTGAALINGNQIVTAFTDNEHFSFQLAGGSGTFTAGAQTGTIVLNQGDAALPVKIVSAVQTNSKVVSYTQQTGQLIWTVGPAVIIQI